MSFCSSAHGRRFCGGGDARQHPTQHAERNSATAPRGRVLGSRRGGARGVRGAARAAAAGRPHLGGSWALSSGSSPRSRGTRRRGQTSRSSRSWRCALLVHEPFFEGVPATVGAGSGAGGMALVAAGLGGASASDDGPVLQLEMMREFSGEDDLAKADMLVLRGLGLADVSVRGAHMARLRRGRTRARMRAPCQ